MKFQPDAASNVVLSGRHFNMPYVTTGDKAYASKAKARVASQFAALIKPEPPTL
jgi:hypothetical protein